MKAKILRILQFLYFFGIAYHVLIIIGLIPYQFAWGGRLKSEKEMYFFEILSLCINLFFVLMVSSCINSKPFRLKPVVYKAFFLITGNLFAINTFGNLYAIYDFEKYVFTPITFFASLFSFIIYANKYYEE